MNIELGFIFMAAILVMGVLIGVAIGFQLSENQNDVGDLVVGRTELHVPRPYHDARGNHGA